jgi:hypothetical protein
MKEFARPLVLDLGGAEVIVHTVDEAKELLMVGWPQELRGPRHRDALDACLKVADGHRSAEDAETALIAAAEEAGFLKAL